MPIGTSDGQYFENIFDYHKRMSDANEMRANETSGDFQSRFLAANAPNTSEVPPEALRKAGDAIVLQGKGYTPEKPVEINSDLDNSRAAFGTMGPAEIPFTPPPVREKPPAGKTLFETKAGPITEGDIGTAIDVAMNFSGGGLTTGKPPVNTKNFDNYIDMFIKEPKKLSGADYVESKIKEWEDYADKYLAENPKVTPKEAFLKGVQNVHDRLVTSFANIRSKFASKVEEGKLEAKAQPHTKAAEAGYTEPAYRGIITRGEDKANPVYNYDKNSGMYSSNSPMLADMYSSYLSKHPGYKVPEGVFDEGAQVMPLYIDTRDYFYHDAKGKHWTEHGANAYAIREAKKAGKKGVIIDNVWDEPNSTHSLGSPKKVFVTFPEGAGTVKSRFAERFDPNSPDILHSIGAVGIGGAAGYISMVDKTDEEKM